jgi:hypothetical protein
MVHKRWIHNGCRLTFGRSENKLQLFFALANQLGEKFGGVEGLDKGR